MSSVAVLRGFVFLGWGAAAAASGEAFRLAVGDKDRKSDGRRVSLGLGWMATAKSERDALVGAAAAGVSSSSEDSSSEDCRGDRREVGRD